MPRHRQNINIKEEQKATPKKVSLTHFLSIPLVTPTSSSELARNLRLFKEDVRHIPTGGGRPASDRTGAPFHSSSEIPSVIPEKAIRPVGTLHLTLGAMRLTDPTKVARAKELLSRINVNDMLQHPQEVLSSPSSPTSSKGISSRPNAEPLVISLRSLHSMHSPRKTSILYAFPSDPTSRLQHFCESLRSQFQASGLLAQDSLPMKLHATIVNTKRANLDATAILSRYEHFVWAGNVLLDRVAICEMGEKSVPVLDRRGHPIAGEEWREYKEVATLSLLPPKRDPLNRCM